MVIKRDYTREHVCTKVSKGITMHLTFHQCQLKLFHRAYSHTPTHLQKGNYLSFKPHLLRDVKILSKPYLFSSLLRLVQWTFHKQEKKQKWETGLTLSQSREVPFWRNARSQTLWHIYCAVTQNSTGRKQCLTSPFTDSKHKKHVGCISAVRRADKILNLFNVIKGRKYSMTRSTANSGFH